MRVRVCVCCGHWASNICVPVDVICSLSLFSVAMEQNRVAKFQDLMGVIDRSGGFYRIPVELPFRSHVNVPFRITVAGKPNAELEATFLSEAAKKGLLQLKVHCVYMNVHVCSFQFLSVATF